MSKKDSLRLLASAHSDGSEEFVSRSAYRIGDEITFRLRIHRESPLSKVIFRCVTNGQEQALPMGKEKSVGHLDYYRIALKVWQKKFHYRFKILTEGRLYHLNAMGLQAHNPPDKDDFRISSDFIPPSWLTDRVFYQIFPDRFFDGDPSTNVRDGEYEYHGHATIARKWGEEPGDYSRAFNLDFFGGDLKGIEKKIPYLKRLGVNALWLNPIFLSPSNHKYDTQDYHTIDPHIGTEKDLIRLIDLLHKEDIRIVLDGVFNHTGSCHFWFNRDGFYREKGAWADPSSPAAEYYISKGDQEFHYWAGFPSLPTLNYNSQKLRDEIYRSGNSVARKYVSPPFCTDGWRLDVADTLARQDAVQLHHEVWPEFRKLVKESNPQAYILGECGTDASELLQGDELDGAMNYYGFCIPLRQWLTGQVVFEPESDGSRSLVMDASDLDIWLRGALSNVPFAAALSMYNLLGSHDCNRVLYPLGRDRKIAKLGYVFLFCYVGIPAVYYGDETGLSGGPTNESARGCMEWDESKWDQDLFDLVRKLIRLRKSSPALQRGGIRTLYCEDNVYGFARFLGRENRIVILNRNPGARKVRVDCSPLSLRSDSELTEALSGAKFSLKDHILDLDLPPFSALLLSQEDH